MTIMAHELHAHFSHRTPATKRRRLPVLTADVPVGRPGWTLTPRCARCQSDLVLAGALCLRCHELAEAARLAQLAAEEAFALVKR